MITMAAKSEKTVKPRGPGKRFVPGNSGNPSGRPKRTSEELDLIAACRTKTSDALDVIQDLMVGSSNPKVRLDAALAIIERGYGRPTQPTTISTPDGVRCEVALTGLDELRKLFAEKEAKA
jgi:uncharacterized protein DUF5681